MRGYGETSIQTVVEALGKEGLQSDSRYTENYIHNRIEKGYGPVRIVHELREKGVDDELIALYLAEQRPDWLQLAGQVRIKRFGRKLPQDFKEQAKQSRFLQQRGFRGEDIYRLFHTGDE
jgi:regulatory protein